MNEAAKQSEPPVVPFKPPSHPFRWLWLAGSVCLLLLTLCVGGAAYGWHWLRVWGERPTGTAGTRHSRIAPRTPTAAIARQFAAAGLIDRPRVFLIWLRLHHPQAILQAGDYTIEGPIAPARLVEKLAHGQFGRSLTIPEGWTTRQIARRLVKEGFIPAEQVWLDLTAQPLPADLLGEAQPSAEGFCFPDTYHLHPQTSAPMILQTMLARFRKEWELAEPARRAGGAAPASLRQVVILASMLEREARIAEEMPLMASVYYNRLAKNMKLQCCASVYYALGLASGAETWDRPLTLADLKINSPFNTYLKTGLPPAPIGNPGRAAIEAALRPASSDFLFYVHRGNQRHIFSRTYADHQAAIASIRQRDPQSALLAGEDGL